MSDLVCPNCGAPISVEVCPYCGTLVAVSSDDIGVDLPTVELTVPRFDIFYIGMPAIFGVSFTLVGLGFVIPFMIGSIEAILFSLPFLIFPIIGIGALCVLIRNLHTYYVTKSKGAIVEGIVYGYVQDDLLINGVPAKKLKVLAKDKYYILKISTTSKMYPVNSKITLRIWKEFAMII